MTPLLISSKKGIIDVVQILLDGGDDIHAIDQVHLNAFKRCESDTNFYSRSIFLCMPQVTKMFNIFLVLM